MAADPASLEGPLPPYIYINIQLPLTAPKLIGKKTDGATCTVLFSFQVTPAAQAAAAAGTMPAAALLRKFVEEARAAGPDKPLPATSPLKAIVHVDNLKEAGFKAFSSILSQYNAKPVLLVKSSRAFGGGDYLELASDVSKWSQVARTSLHKFKGKISDMDLRVGFLVQGGAAGEMPERLLGCAALRGLTIAPAGGAGSGGIFEGAGGDDVGDDGDGEGGGDAGGGSGGGGGGEEGGGGGGDGDGDGAGEGSAIAEQLRALCKDNGLSEEGSAGALEARLCGGLGWDQATLAQELLVLSNLGSSDGK
jgi:hypothetical protein